MNYKDKKLEVLHGSPTYNEWVGANPDAVVLSVDIAGNFDTYTEELVITKDGNDRYSLLRFFGDSLLSGKFHISVDVNNATLPECLKSMQAQINEERYS